MILNKIDDPRDNLERARQAELVRFAQSHGLKHITDQVPAILIRAELRQRGLTNIRIPPRPLGATNQPNPIAPGPGAKIVEVNAAADLARQFAQQQARPPDPHPIKPERPKRLVERPKSEINRLRDQCKALGIKMDRRDRMPDLKAKIEAHGKNAAQ